MEKEEEKKRKWRNRSCRTKTRRMIVGKVKLSICLTFKHCAMKTYGEWMYRSTYS
jgi:hypothetical protein